MSRGGRATGAGARVNVALAVAITHWLTGAAFLTRGWTGLAGLEHKHWLLSRCLRKCGAGTSWLHVSQQVSEPTHCQQHWDRHRSCRANPMGAAEGQLSCTLGLFSSNSQKWFLIVPSLLPAFLPRMDMLHFLRMSRSGRTSYYGHWPHRQHHIFRSFWPWFLMCSDALSCFSSALLAPWEGCLPSFPLRPAWQQNTQAAQPRDCPPSFFSGKVVTTCMKGLSPWLFLCLLCLSWTRCMWPPQCAPCHTWCSAQNLQVQTEHMLVLYICFFYTCASFVQPNWFRHIDSCICFPWRY